MRLSVRRLALRWGRRLQRLYAQAVRRGAPPKRGGAPGGSLPSRLLDSGLLSLRRWGVVFSPSALGSPFRWWWQGTSRQRSRGGVVSIDKERLAAELAAELHRQIHRADRS